MLRVQPLGLEPGRLVLAAQTPRPHVLGLAHVDELAVGKAPRMLAQRLQGSIDLARVELLLGAVEEREFLDQITRRMLGRRRRRGSGGGPGGSGSIVRASRRGSVRRRGRRG